MQRVAVEIDDVRARKHQPVMVRLVAVAVDQEDVAGLDQRLQHDLVGGRGAVGDEVGALRAEGARGQLLRLLDRAGRLQQRVEPARGRRGLGQEDVHPVELAHVLDPVGFGDRLAAADRHGVEHAGRLAAVLLERGEERRLVAGVDAAQDVQVQLEEVLLLVEHPQAVGRRAPGHLLDRDVGHDVDAQLGPQAADHLAQQDAAIGGRDRLERRLIDPEQLALQHRDLVHAAIGEAEADDDGLDVEVGEDGDQRVLDALQHEQFIDERVVGASRLAHAQLERGLLQRPHRVDHQHLEIGPAMRRFLAQLLGGLDLALAFGRLLAGAQRHRAPAIGIARQGTHDPAGERAEAAVVLGLQQSAQAGDRVAAGEHPVALDRLEQVQRLADALAQPFDVALAHLGFGEAQGIVLEPIPGIGAQLAGIVVLAEGQLATLRPWLGLELVHPRPPCAAPIAPAAG